MNETQTTRTESEEQFLHALARAERANVRMQVANRALDSLVEEDCMPGSKQEELGEVSMMMKDQQKELSSFLSLAFQYFGHRSL
jgi:DNA-binding SARP family transcriptional activator